MSNSAKRPPEKRSKGNQGMSNRVNLTKNPRNEREEQLRGQMSRKMITITEPDSDEDEPWAADTFASIKKQVNIWSLDFSQKLYESELRIRGIQAWAQEEDERGRVRKRKRTEWQNDVSKRVRAATKLGETVAELSRAVSNSQLSGRFSSPRLRVVYMHSCCGKSTAADKFTNLFDIDVALHANATFKAEMTSARHDAVSSGDWSQVTALGVKAVAEYIGRHPQSLDKVWLAHDGSLLPPHELLGVYVLNDGTFADHLRDKRGSRTAECPEGLPLSSVSKEVAKHNRDGLLRKFHGSTLFTEITSDDQLNQKLQAINAFAAFRGLQVTGASDTLDPAMTFQCEPPPMTRRLCAGEEAAAARAIEDRDCKIYDECDRLWHRLACEAEDRDRAIYASINRLMSAVIRLGERVDPTSANEYPLHKEGYIMDVKRAPSPTPVLTDKQRRKLNAQFQRLEIANGSKPTTPFIPFVRAPSARRAPSGPSPSPQPASLNAAAAAFVPNFAT